MATVVYNEAKKQIANGGIDLDSSTLKVMLVDPTYVADPDQSAIDDGTAGDAASHEITGAASYVRQDLTGRVVVKDTTNDFSYLDADDTPFGALELGPTIGGALVLKSTGVDTTSIPICFYPIVPNIPTNGANMTVLWASPANGGVMKLA